MSKGEFVAWGYIILHSQSGLVLVSYNTHVFFFCGMHESIAQYLQGQEFFLSFFFLVL